MSIHPVETDQGLNKGRCQLGAADLEPQKADEISHVGGLVQQAKNGVEGRKSVVV